MLLEKENQSRRQLWSVLPGKVTGQGFSTVVRNAEGWASLLIPWWLEAGRLGGGLLGAFCVVSGALTSICRSAWRGGSMPL